MKILNIGSCNIDYVYTVDHIVTGGETISTKNMEIFPGGKGLNQTIAAARAGADIYHAGCIGNNGGFLADILADSGADISLIKRENIPNGHAIIQVDKYGENCIFLYSGSNGVITEEYVDGVLKHFDKGDFLVLQNEVNNLEYIIKKGFEKGLQIVFNPAPFASELKNIDLKCISYLVVNEVEAKGFYDTDDYNDFISYIIREYPHIKLVLTLGKVGSIYADADNCIYQPAYVVNAVDTTAAGDTFIGYFVSLVASGKEYERAMKYASAASALAVSEMGAAPSIPVYAEVEEALRSLVPGESPEKTKEDLMKKKILHYIDQNINTANLQELAEVLGYSKSYAATYVKNIMTDGFTTVLQKRRCEFAADMLKNTTMSISEIISKTGYENETFFRNKFKEFYGVSPLAYRKNQ